MTSELLKGLPAAVVALVGVAIAWAWYQNVVVGGVAVAIAVVIAIRGYLWLDEGRRLLREPDRDPAAAVSPLERAVTLDLAGGAAGSAALIIIAVWLAGQLPQGTPEIQKQLLTAAAGALTALITAVFVKRLEDFASVSGGTVKTEFVKTYEGCFTPGSNEWRAINDPNFQGKEGWSTGEARRTRAAAVAGKPCRPSAPEQPDVEGAVVGGQAEVAGADETTPGPQ